MGVDLIGYGGIGHGDLSFNWGFWRSCLKIAIAFGWQPAGIIAPRDCDREWSGTYFTNGFQEVSEADARALGTALHQAINSLRTGHALTEEQAEALAGMDIVGVRRFADFAVSGPFAIS